MSNQPPIPCPDCTKPLVFDYDHYKCSGCRCDFTHPWGLTPGQMATLWRLWTRGMAVVPLPEPTTTSSGYPFWEPADQEGPYWKVEPDTDEDGTFLRIEAPGTPDLAQAKEFFTAGLAACELADRVIAEFLARPKGAAEANAEAVNQP